MKSHWLLLILNHTSWLLFKAPIKETSFVSSNNEITRIFQVRRNLNDTETLDMISLLSSFNKRGSCNPFGFCCKSLPVYSLAKLIAPNSSPFTLFWNLLLLIQLKCFSLCFIWRLTPRIWSRGRIHIWLSVLLDLWSAKNGEIHRSFSPTL